MTRRADPDPRKWLVRYVGHEHVADQQGVWAAYPPMRGDDGRPGPFLFLEYANALAYALARSTTHREDPR